MQVDRRRFLALTTALAAACAPAAPVRPVEPTAPAPVATAPTPLVLPTPPPATAPPEVKAAPPEECAEEDVGSLAVCDKLAIAPTCEDASDLQRGCNQLATRYRPAVAERLAACLQSSVAGAKGKHCPREWGSAACRRQAIKSVCVRASAREKCTDMIANCKRRSQRVRYTLDQCAITLSAAAPSYVGDHVYTMGGIDSQGVPWREGCWTDLME